MQINPCIVRKSTVCIFMFAFLYLQDIPGRIQKTLIMRVGRELVDWTSGYMLFIYFFIWLCRVFSSCGGYSSLQCLGFSLQLTSLVAKHRLQGTWASVVAERGLSSFGSRASEHRPVAAVPGLSSLAACGIFPDQGLNLVSCTGRQSLYQ